MTPFQIGAPTNLHGVQCTLHVTLMTAMHSVDGNQPTFGKVNLRRWSLRIAPCGHAQHRIFTMQKQNRSLPTTNLDLHDRQTPISSHGPKLHPPSAMLRIAYFLMDENRRTRVV